MAVKNKPKKHRNPLFKTLKARVGFTVTMTVILLFAIGAASLIHLFLNYRQDILAAQLRLATAATAEMAAELNGAEGVLRDLGDAAATGTVLVDCARLTSLAASRLTFSDVGLVAPSGAVMCDSRGGQFTAAERDFLIRTAQNGSYSSAVLSMGSIGNEIAFAYPAKNQAGEIAAVAFGIFNSETLAAIMHPPQGNVIGLADGQGRTILLLNAARTERTVSPTTPPVLAEQLAASPDGTVETVDADGTIRIFAFRAVQTAGGVYRLYVGADRNDAFRQAWTSAALAGGGLIALSGLVYLMMLGIGRLLIARRARKVAESIALVIQKKLDPEDLPRGLGELDGVTAMYEELARKLRVAEETMEKNIKTRTSALEYSREISELDKARTEALLTSIGEGVVATETDGRITFLNDVAKEGLFWTPEAAENAVVHSAFRLESEKQEIVDPADWPTVKVLETGNKLVTPAPAKPFYLRRNDHTRFPIKMTVSPILLNGQMMGTLLIFNDITDEVEFDRRKSEFISIASHQLRSPITAIRWMVDMLIKGDVGKLTEKQLDWGQKLALASAKLSELVDELLNISRLESGVKMSLTINDTGIFLGDTLKQLEPLIAGKRQTFKLVVPANLPKLKFDALVMGEVLKNLVSNASKYSPENSAIGITVTVGAESVRFAVKDTGMGIPKSDHSQMFNKFFRAENALKSTVTGTGLGLYYCKSAMDTHHGTIDFESEEGKGSTFWFELPLVK